MDSKEFTHRECELCQKQREVTVVEINDMALNLCYPCADKLEEKIK